MRDDLVTHAGQTEAVENICQDELNQADELPNPWYRLRIWLGQDIQAPNYSQRDLVTSQLSWDSALCGLQQR
jgi:copper oxidase (laccase) domain-containing protein